MGLLLRALLLQARYGLGDPAAAEALRDRLSFRRFLGVALDPSTPDHDTLWRFREELAKRGLAERLRAAANGQLAAPGMILRQGTPIDATLVAASVAAANRRKDGSPVDADARWTRRGRRSLDAQGFRNRIHAAGAADRVMHAGRRHRRPKPWQRWMNKTLAPIRGAVERVFGTLERSDRADRARFCNGPRNAVDPTLKGLASNLRRALNLAEPRPSSA